MGSETKHLFTPYGNLNVMSNRVDKVKVNDTEICKVKVNNNLVYENHHGFRGGILENNGSSNGKHIGRCDICGDTQKEAHTGPKTPVYNTTTNHKYICTKYDSHGNRCRGYYLEDHSKITYTGANLRHTATCGDCHGSGTENHSGGGWKPLYSSNGTINSTYHGRSCTKCGYLDSEKHSLSYKSYNSEKHTVTCGVCNGSGSVYHSGGNGSKYDDTYHKRTCEKCGYVDKQQHNFLEYYGKSGNNFISNCGTTGCSGKDSVNKGSIGYKNVPCGNGNTMNIQIEYDGKNKLSFKINSGNHYIVYTGNGESPGGGAVHVGNGGYRPANANKKWTYDTIKLYKYKKLFVIEGNADGKGTAYTGNPSSGYRIGKAYYAYEDSNYHANSTFPYSQGYFSNSKTSIPSNAIEAMDNTYIRFIEGYFQGFGLYSDTAYSQSYILYPYRSGGKTGLRSLVNPSSLVFCGVQF